VRNVALDLGTKAIAYCEVRDGQVIERTTVGTLWGLEALLGPKAPPARVAIEACREAWAVHKRLTAWDNDVLLVDTTRSRQLGIGQHRRKNDRIDAETLARAVERGGIPAAHVLSPHRQELRRQLSVRRALVETRTQYVTTIRGIVRESGEALGGCDTERFLSKVREATLSAELRAVIQPLLTTLEVIQKQLVSVEEQLAKLCAAEPVVAQLATAPGVGQIVAASFVSVIDDAKRFHQAHQVESYLGLVPSEDSTGGKRRLGAISKRGNSYLRSLLVQAGWAILRLANRDDPLQRWGDAVLKRRGKKVATVALARRLAGVLWAMWRDATVYDPERLASHGARGLKISAQTLQYRATMLERAAAKVRRAAARAPQITEVTTTT
jgi:transposase